MISNWLSKRSLLGRILDRFIFFIFIFHLILYIFKKKIWCFVVRQFTTVAVLTCSEGLLEKPSFPPHLMPEECRYKIFLVGRSGVGKTCSVAKLAGNEVPQVHSESPGTCLHRLMMASSRLPRRVPHTSCIMLYAGRNLTLQLDTILFPDFRNENPFCWWSWVAQSSRSYLIYFLFSWLKFTLCSRLLRCHKKTRPSSAMLHRSPQ